MNPNGMETRAINPVKPTNTTIRAISLAKFQRVSIGGTMASTNEDVDNCEDSSNLACRGLLAWSEIYVCDLYLIYFVKEYNSHTVYESIN